MKEIVVVGGGGHAKVLISILKKLKNFTILGYTDFSDKGNLLGVKYLGDDGILGSLKAGHPGVSAAIGLGSVDVESNYRRSLIYNKLYELGYELPGIVSPDAIINEGVEIGNAAVLYDGVIVNTGTKIGIGVILNTKCSVDHDCIIDNFVHLAPGVTLSGGVEVGEGVFVGTGASIIHYKKVVKDCLIGAGAVIIDDCLEPGTYIGVPAKRKS